MGSVDMLETLKSAEAFGFLKVPIPIPPTIEEAFKYRGGERYVALGFGVHGCTMDDFVGDSARPQLRDLYRSFLLHPALKSYTDAFQIETDPPAWLEGMDIAEFDSRREQIEIWSNTSRCLLLDRDGRQFFVGTVSEVLGWLIMRGAVYAKRKRTTRRKRASSSAAVKALFDWLRTLPSPSLPREFVDDWERRFGERQAIAGCTGAAFRLGFDEGDIRRMMIEAFRSPNEEV